MNVHDGHRQRLREKYLADGADSFADHNLLELLLCYSRPRGDVNPLAHELINTFGSFAGVFSAPYEELLKVEGTGQSTALLIRLIRDICSRYEVSLTNVGRTLTNTEDAGRYLMPYFIGKSQETVYIVCLDGKHKVLYCGEIGAGDSRNVDITVRSVLETSLRHGAADVLLAHNHPSGVALPSSLDIESTQNMRETLGSVGIRLVEHLIFSGDDFVSMAENGMLPGMGLN